MFHIKFSNSNIKLRSRYFLIKVIDQQVVLLCQEFIGKISTQTFIKYILCSKHCSRPQRWMSGQEGHIFQYAYCVPWLGK